eukprot:gb/GECG01010791.1/.p1 GENE.gb/GECG01010791.1/~~gb/GECG01010791.1/.p1  ORF type:complete len:241 (+),score=16.90 gb/GECG01010791.1/:1-723(+)
MAELLLSDRVVGSSTNKPFACSTAKGNPLQASMWTLQCPISNGIQQQIPMSGILSRDNATKGEFRLAHTAAIGETNPGTETQVPRSNAARSSHKFNETRQYIYASPYPGASSRIVLKSSCRSRSDQQLEPGVEPKRMRQEHPTANDTTKRKIDAELPYECKLCRRGYGTLSALSMHLRTKHELLIRVMLGLKDSDKIVSAHGRSVGGFINGEYKPSYWVPVCTLQEALELMKRPNAREFY